MFIPKCNISGKGRFKRVLAGKFNYEGAGEILQILISNHRSAQGIYIDSIHEDPSEMNLHFQEFIQLFERNHMLLHHNDYIYLAGDAASIIVL